MIIRSLDNNLMEKIFQYFKDTKNMLTNNAESARILCV